MDDFLRCDIDAVILTNYANEHARYAVSALAAGKHVMSEVLPVQTLAEAVALCEAVEKSGKVYSYAENYCYFNQNFEMRLRYDRGDIGELVNAECDFINDCSFKWHLLTRGNRNHWRNFVPSTFYCTHSIGPMLFISGQRPKYVVGMESPLTPYMAKHGARSGSAGMEIMQLENGAMAKSLNGNLKHPYLQHCRMIGTKGGMENDSWDHGKLHVYIEGEQETVFSHEEYLPETFTKSVRTSAFKSPVESGIFYATEFFVGTILGDETAKRYGIDVYQALDMSLPGLLAYRSILKGSVPIEVPDFRNKAVRENFRNDHTCTDPKVATGDQLLPSCKSGNVTVPDEVYSCEAQKFTESLKTSFRLGSN
jgi:predicted dehydrogenase